MSKVKQNAGSNVAVGSTFVKLDAVQHTDKNKASAPGAPLAALNSSFFATWRGNGAITLNINCPIIHAGSTVLIGISEYSNTADPAGSRFIGAARYAVYNISPREGGVVVWMEISWGQPINIYIELVVN
jgi:hypothetical protein